MAANQPKTYNFKFQLRRPKVATAETEFYRAALSQNIARDFAQLNEKIVELMPAVQNRSYALTWADSDGDEITVTDNAALEIALKEMTGSVCK